MVIIHFGLVAHSFTIDFSIFPIWMCPLHSVVSLGALSDNQALSSYEMLCLWFLVSFRV